MSKSFLEKLANQLGRATGKAVDKAREAGLDEKAKTLFQKAEDKIQDLVEEFKGAQAQHAESTSEAHEDAEATPDTDSQEATEEASDGCDRGEDSRNERDANERTEQESERE